MGSKVFSDWQRLKVTPGAMPIPHHMYIKMNRKRQSELWRESYIVYMLERRGFNFTFVQNCLNITHVTLVKKFRQPDRFTFDELKKLSRLLNITLFELIAIIDMNQDDDAAKYTAERYYQDMLKSKTVIEYQELKRLNALVEVHPAELEKALDEYREKYE